MAMTYDEAVRRLGRRTSVQIDKRRGTEYRRAPGEAGDRGDIQVSYRGTPVVTFHPDKTYTLRTGGMATKTVIKRIAEFSPISLRRQGNGFFIEDVNTGKLMPFLEGARVDQQGRVLDDDSGLIVDNPQSAPVVPHAPTTVAPTPQMVDEARLRTFIKRTVLEVLSETVMPANPAAPLRPINARVQASRITTSAAGDGTGVPLDIVEKLLAATAGPEKAKRMVRDLRNSMMRGRDRVDDYADAVGDDGEIAAPAVELAEAADTGIQNQGPRCGQCTEPQAMHYDKANRYRGCDYALVHSGEKVELIR